MGSGRSPCPVASGTVYLSSAALLGGGFVYALDGATGKTRWSFDSVIDPAGDKIIGGGAWNPPAIGPDGTVYIGFGNMHQPAAAALAHPGKRLYTDSTVALDGKTGKLKWYLQAVPNDFHDWDMQLSPIYTHIGGRAVIVNAAKMGYVYAMDAASGKLVWKTKVGVHNGTHSREPPTRARRRSRPRSASGDVEHDRAPAPEQLRRLVDRAPRARGAVVADEDPAVFHSPRSSPMPGSGASADPRTSCGDCARDPRTCRFDSRRLRRESGRMETLGKTLLVFAIMLAVVGGVVLLFSRLGVSRLPGDVVLRGKNVTVYFPLGLSILLSVLPTVLLNLVWRR